MVVGNWRKEWKRKAGGTRAFISKSRGHRIRGKGLKNKPKKVVKSTESILLPPEEDSVSFTEKTVCGSTHSRLWV